MVLGVREWDGVAPYHPAALERLTDSIKGVSRHGFLSLMAMLLG